MAIHELFPYLCVHDAGAAIDFYCKVFEVKEIFRLTEPSGRIGQRATQKLPEVAAR